MSDPHRNDHLVMDPGLVTPDAFLQAIFGEFAQYAHVTAFPDDPSDIGKDDRGRCWAGRWYKNWPNIIQVGWNAYFTISLFHPVEEVGGFRAVRWRDHFVGMHVVVLDDVGTAKIDPRMLALLPEPSWKLETSPGNYQWGYILLIAEGSRVRSDAVLDGLVQQGLAPDGVDPGMRGVTRYVRIPGAWNTKAKYRDVEGNPFQTRLVEWHPDRLFALEDLAEPFGIDLAGLVDHGNGVIGGMAAAWPEESPVMQWVAEHHLGDKRGTDGQYHIVCPWVEEHSDGDDSGTWVITHDDGTLGFKCHHGHCQHRTGGDFLAETGLKAQHDTWRTSWVFGRQLAELAANGGLAPPGLPAPGPAPGGDGFPPGGGGGSGGDGGDPGDPGAMASIRALIAVLPEDPASDAGVAAVSRFLSTLAELRVQPIVLEQAFLELHDRYPGGRLSMRTIREQYRAIGQESARERREAVAAGGQGEGPHPLLREYCYIKTKHLFWHWPSGAALKVEALNMVLGHVPFFDPTAAGPNGEGLRVTPAKAFELQAPEHKQLADRLGWRPAPADAYRAGQDWLYWQDGQLFCNTYRPPQLTPAPYGMWEEEIELLVLLFKHICGRHWELVRQHFAYSLRYPNKKIRWQILIFGDARIGKSLLTLLIKRVFGATCRVIEPHHIDGGWGDPFYGAKFLIIEEVYRPRDRKWNNQLKSKLANSDDELLNMKGGAMVVQRNVASMVLLSNHVEAMEIDPGNSKLLVIEARGFLGGLSEEEAHAQLNRLGDWLETDIGAAKGMQWLLDTDLTDFPAHRLPERTEAYYKMAAAAQDDYAIVLEEWVEDRTGPFDADAIKFEEIRTALQQLGYRAGNAGVKAVLGRHGWANYQGQRRVDGKKHAVRFWAPVSRCERLSAADLYGYWEEARAMPAGLPAGEEGKT